jgi:hypothetical protein
MKRYELIVELFDILMILAAYGHTRNELQQLKTRAVQMFNTFERIGPLQEQSVMFHLIIELIVQAMRWGPPSSVWCYFLERIMGHLVRGIKSKRHAEANIMSRYRNTLAPCRAFSVPRFQFLEAVLSQPKKSSPVDKFPSRARDGLYLLNSGDFEDIHSILLSACACYQRLAKEFHLFNEHSTTPGSDILQRKPRSAPLHSGSRNWNRHGITLACAIAAFHIRQVSVIYSGVILRGTKRTGCNKTAPNSEHKHAYSIFTFNEQSPLSGRVGRILFMFKYKIEDSVITNQVRDHEAVFFATYCATFVVFVDQDEKQPLLLAKVQLLGDCGFCPNSRRPIVCLHRDNPVMIVLLRTIGNLTVIGAHPDPTRAAQSHYLVLAWPRREFLNVQPEELE